MFLDQGISVRLMDGVCEVDGHPIGRIGSLEFLEDRLDALPQGRATQPQSQRL
jgi:hypothetical protein